MEFRILGPLEIVAGSDRVPSGGTRQQIVLGSLLLEANRVVPIARLTDAIYGIDVPSTGRAQTQICISALRRLFASHGRPDAIQTRSQGYLLQLDQADLDLTRYDSLVTRARAEAEADRPGTAARDYRAALALWRGSALQGLGSVALQGAAEVVDERRIAATEDCIEIELGLGLHRDLVGELTELIAAHPLRERLRGQLMLALYRSGRRAEALEVFHQARRSLVQDLGLEPSEWLRRLQHLILVSDAALRTPVLPAAPAQRPVVTVAPPAPAGVGPQLLPTDIADFTGYDDHLAAVRGVLTGAGDGTGRQAVPVVVVVGRPGAGKTALAVHAAHALAESFPGGLLFTDLHGSGPDPVAPDPVLGRFLHAFGDTGAGVAGGLDQRAERYRARLAGLRTLVVLDDAADEEQVRPLLPGARGSAVLVTSRRWLPGLPGSVHITVGALDRPASIELLSRMLGAQRVGSERAAAADLAELCGDLPLALRIAGARIAGRPHWNLRRLADRLAADKDPAAQLAHGGMSLRESVRTATDGLSAPARRLFHLLGQLDHATFSARIGAALLDVSVAEAGDLLDALADVHLIDIVVTRPDRDPRYAFHTLFGACARAEGQERIPPEQLAAAADRASREAAWLLTARTCPPCHLGAGDGN
ncbi:hypothetical protein GCM10010435_23820 [Winogradskya consettensis]|uniref:OmpR/PhoB-type domain-containing protein n=1 Tax=Winogradskya consettensis TaxID=113560 RepID=A0A919VYA5_9ACTN|nr:AfsR/SARP family transcriptional regulator [Actinoplanes consettensis]GIM82380.1 hypothetical protein Aco04nite_81220 [Actinoplanes consettensis]